MGSKSPNPIDKHLGRRLRMRRVVLGLSQEAVAKPLGITFQQVQKYENAANRISASRLFEIARALGVTIPWLFEGAPETKEQRNFKPPVVFPSTLQEAELVEAWAKIKDPKTRLRIVSLIKTLARLEQFQNLMRRERSQPLDQTSIEPNKEPEFLAQCIFRREPKNQSPAPYLAGL